MRIELNEENTRKATEAERQLREQYGVSLSPNQIVNIVFGAIEQLELQQTVTVTFKPTAAQLASGGPVKRKIARKVTNWVTGFK